MRILSVLLLSVYILGSVSYSWAEVASPSCFEYLQPNHESLEVSDIKVAIGEAIQEADKLQEATVATADHYVDVQIKDEGIGVSLNLMVKDFATDSMVMDFIIYHSKISRDINVGFFTISEAYRRQGLSTSFINEILKLYSDTRSISSYHLGGDNYSQFIKAIKRGLKCEEALKLTPAYKARAKMGFTEIVQSNCKKTDGDLSLVVQRP